MPTKTKQSTQYWLRVVASSREKENEVDFDGAFFGTLRIEHQPALSILLSRQSKALEDALLITKYDFGKIRFWYFVINKASSSVLLCLNHNHEGDIEKVV